MFLFIIRFVNRIASFKLSSDFCFEVAKLDRLLMA